jgi:hypothetical protein
MDNTVEKSQVDYQQVPIGEEGSSNPPLGIEPTIQGAVNPTDPTPIESTTTSIDLHSLAKLKESATLPLHDPLL